MDGSIGSWQHQAWRNDCTVSWVDARPSINRPLVNRYLTPIFMLLHPSVSPWVERSDHGVHLTLFVAGDEPSSAQVRALPDNEHHQIAMAGERVRTGLWRYRALLPWDGGNDVTRYVFKVLAGKAQRWLAADGEHAHVPPEDVHFRVNRVHAPPAWVPEQIFYQVFVDRFARAGPPTDRRGEIVYGATARPVVQKQWGEPLEIRHASNTFYGGDLAGVSSRLDYLQNELGVTAIYLTPVFTAGSNHKYDSEDFAHVDPHLGGDAALIALREQTRKRGMRLLLDAVVNHTGTNHPWFNRWGQHATLGAYQSPDSPYRSWYVFDAAGQAWGWKGAASLPVLDFAAAGVRDAIYGGSDAVLRHWLRPPFAID